MKRMRPACCLAGLGVVCSAALAQPAGRCGEGGGGIRFVVAEWPGQEFHHDAYTLILSEPDDVAHARRLIAEGPSAGSPIVYARIAVGADGINRNWRAPGAPAWSWHVVEFYDFAESTAEIFDYWPGGIEMDPQGWVDGGTKGGIGFWTYTVVEELPPACPGDFNCDNSVTSADLFEFLGAFFAQDEVADYTADGVIDSRDFFAYIGAFFAGCS
jgi:hypothetical protein